MTAARALPDSSARRARAFTSSGKAAVPPTPASSVVLLRDGVAGLEAYVHRRHATMAFAGGMVAFPGGGVDDRDLVPHPDLDAGAWAARLRTDELTALGFVQAAIRETHEETGVVIPDTALIPWAHWITPRFEATRYDTWFFLAALREGQEPEDISGEASATMWIGPAEALRRADNGTWLMLPPTRSVLADLASYTSVSAIPTTRGHIDTILPGWLDLGDAVVALLPDDPRYPGDDPGDSRFEDDL